FPRPAPTAWWPKGKICRRGTPWSAEILRPCTRPASPRQGGCWLKAASRMRIGKTTSSFGCREAINSPPPEPFGSVGAPAPGCEQGVTADELVLVLPGVGLARGGVVAV